MNTLKHIIKRAALKPKHIVLAEGHDIRVVEAAVKAAHDNIAQITLLGNATKIQTLIRQVGGNPDSIAIIDPAISPKLEPFATRYLELESKKTPDMKAAKKVMRDPVNFAHMMVQVEHCDGSLAGAIYSSGDVIRSAKTIIGPDPDHNLISSFFIMIMPDNLPGISPVLIFADCAWVVSPAKAQLAAIAAMTADSAKVLLDIDPRIALLSFSTRGSARHSHVRKIELAGEILKDKRPDLPVEAAVQFDAAIHPDVAAIKAPDSDVAGQANILIFPDLNAGNIGYKIAQRIGGAVAIGPVLQGLKRPANDLSRGCDSQDIYNMIAVTGVQAQVISPA